MLEVLNGEASKSYKKKKLLQNNQNNGQYALIKRFNHEHWLIVYMYAFMQFYPETTTE